ncbi:hypothetical protein AYI98_17975 [Shewanella algae]|uniref:hypothetical protein n=1 Tax=Shewanella algae TaxID=38313 RepID=UPI001183B403|nr:hypothetical protein [Shewanella algae]TVL44063.1 hypothetical protein AYI98_17975 [Shewanella algae]
MKIIETKDITNYKKISFDKNTYQLKHIENCLARFTQFASFNINSNVNDIDVDVDLISNSELNVSDLCHLIRNEVMLESLRIKIAEETEVERNLILSYAFSNTKLVG